MSTFTPLGRTIRNLKRYAEILEVLARHGCHDVVHELRLDRLIEKGRSLVGARPAVDAEPVSRAVRLRRAMEELGPTFIKMGQVLSTRPDLIPEDWAEEFRNLQDDCPQIDYALIRACLEEEFPGRVGDLFKRVDETPLAAGSMAQVHRAVLADGTKIVLKVLRPGIREVTAADMEILRTLASFAENHLSNLGYSPTEVVNEFARELEREVDLTNEARSTDRLRGYFEEDEGVVFPMVYWGASTDSVLALEEIEGIALSRLEDGELTQEERKAVVANGARAVLRQCLEIGFFHADPHPGNLFALPGGRIAFIDCGMTGQLDGRTTQQLAQLVSGVASGDTDRVLSVIVALADVGPEKLEERAFRADVHGFVSHFENTPLERLNIGALLDEFFGKLRAHRVRCPADLVLLIKAMTTIESVGASLDPQFDMVGFARPYLERLVRKRYRPAALRKRLADALLHYTELVEDLPGDLRTLLNQFRRSRLAINLEHRGLDRLTGTIEHASRNISFSLIVAAMLVGSSILILADRDRAFWGLTAVGFAGFVSAGVLTVMMVISNRRRGNG